MTRITQPQECFLGNIVRKTVGVMIVVVFVNMTACGYFLYPERVGQKGGKLDPAIVVLDAAALLIGILPGVVAFAVDITTGAIYLSPNQKSVIDKHSRHQTLIDGKKLRPADEEEILINQLKTAHELSQILGYPVKAALIEYYKTVDMTSAVAVIPGKF